jgi:hypothetical protein
MPSKLQNNWSISALLQVTQQLALNRFEYAARDVVRSAVHIQKITVYDGKDPGTGSRTVYKVRSKSWPQYYPYLTQKDSRGRARTYQRTYFHEYDVIISMDFLTLITPIKIRTGADKKWIFNPNPALIKSKTNKYGQYLSVGDYNAKMGINGDMFFAHSFNRKIEGCLYGRNYANKAPEKYPTCFLTKHEIVVIETLMESGTLKRN